MRDLLRRLYSGDNDVDFLSHWRRMLVVAAAVIAVSAGLLWVRGLDLSIEFEGGTVWEVQRGPDVSTDDVENAVTDAGVANPRVQELAGNVIRVRGQAEVSDPAVPQVTEALAELNGVSVDDVSAQSVSASWGDEITKKARSALVWFLLLIAAYITLRFEWRMAVGAIVSVVHDILLSVGFYALFQFEVTPATVIAFLTIMGYSLYDTIVVFDKVKENTALMSVRAPEPYELVVNRSMNQVIMRSINTTLTSIIPVFSMLVVGSFILGAGALREFALALLVGMIAGAYSSVFVATPVLIWLKGLGRTDEARRRRRARATTLVERPSLADAEAPADGEDAVADPAPQPPPVANPAGTGGPPRPRKRRRR